MRSGYILVAALACAWLGAGAAPASAAGRRLSIRLVEASDTGPTDARGLEDVIGVLRESLRYKSFVALDSQAIVLPARRTSCRMHGYTLICTGDQAGLQITIRRGKKELLNTQVKLRDNKPLMLGGFPSRQGKLVFVFLVN